MKCFRRLLHIKRLQVRRIKIMIVEQHGQFGKGYSNTGIFVKINVNEYNKVNSQ